MALINYVGNYHKIESVDIINNTVYISKWENEEHRIQGDTSFKKHQDCNVHLPNLYNALLSVSEDKTILDNIKTIAYIELQKEPLYNEMGFDVIPVLNNENETE